MPITETVGYPSIVVSSPDGVFRGTAVATELLDIEFNGAPDLGRYTPSGLADQIAAVLRDVMAKRQKVTRESMRKAGFEFTDQPHWDARQRRFHAALDKVEARGRSRGDTVKVAILGAHRDYRVRIRPRLLEDPDPEHVLKEVHSAYAKAVLDLRRQRNELLREHLPS